MSHSLEDRHQAGKRLAKRLERYRRHPNCLLLGIPRGGVVLAYEMARELDLPMDACIVRKLGVPFQPELAMGAIASGGVQVLHRDLIAEWGITPAQVDQEIAAQTVELDRRERLYRAGKPPLRVGGKTVILVDDGIATGATVEAAILCLRSKEPERIVVAAGVATRSTVEMLCWLADEVECVLTPERLGSVGAWYVDFEAVSDAEVGRLLAAAGSRAEVVH